MKIRSVRANSRKRVFQLATWRQRYEIPYFKVDPVPSPSDPVVAVTVDPELGAEAFTYELASGAEGTVHIDQVLDHNQDPAYMRDLILYRLTLEAKQRVAEYPMSKRQIIRRLGTSPTQFYRLLDTANSRKSVDRMLELLHVLECEVDLVVKR